ncbi:MAG TPA: leucine--tRNA ligase [Pyrinomonadaceae bacterium]|nr:leucine--tRNA ligase [Pyrinomonadaceae bacterium]
MDDKYFPKKVEQKWQKKWAESGAFNAEVDDSRPKFYQLEMLPYPSGNLHMGHVRNYSAGDVVAWFKRLKGFNVLHPIGWDSFGQPAEDAAIKRGVNPREWTEENILAMRGQLERLGLSYDWRRQMAAHRPEFYKFDQWFFLKMHERGLAYKRMTQVNWCEHDQATLSNEQASGGLCWRCGNPVTKKDLEQWFLKTTNYADELVDGLDGIEHGWPAHVVKRQRDWIGRSEGAFLDFGLRISDLGLADDERAEGLVSVRVFTTRIDTVYGANAIVVAAEHPVIEKFETQFAPVVRAKIEEIRAEKLKPTDREVEIDKDGVDTGLKAVNPFSGEELPIWVGNYVMMEYGTGAVMSVPAHDERDFDFATKFGLPIKQVIEPQRRGDAEEESAKDESAIRDPQSAKGGAVTDYGVMINSGEWNGTPTSEAKSKMAQFAKENGFGEAAITYRLRDWGISRQRFWGSPIPMIYCGECGVVPEKYENLPVRLPENAPLTGTGESPLTKVPEFYETTCPECDGLAHRETDTMDTFVDSSWYFFRYTDPQNDSMPFDPAVAARWTPVDQYIGGDDHAVMHLIYTRFWGKVMRDIGLVNFDEPVTRLLTQGMVVGETFFDDETGKRIYFPPDAVEVTRDAKGKITEARSKDGKVLKHAIERMSKSKGNGVDPDEMVDIYGADAARLFIMFAAPIENELVWNEAGIEGAVRFLQRVWRLTHKWKDALSSNQPSEFSEAARGLRRKTHQTIKRVSDSIETLQFNTPVAALMELANAIGDVGFEPNDAGEDVRFAVREALSSLVIMLAPFCPHVAEELYESITGDERGIVAGGVRFPEFSEELAKADAIEIPVQLNGKLRSRIFAPPDASNDVLEKMAFADEKIAELVDGKDVVKVVVVPGRLVNIVIRG